MEALSLELLIAQNGSRQFVHPKKSGYPYIAGRILRDAGDDIMRSPSCCV